MQPQHPHQAYTGGGGGGGFAPAAAGHMNAHVAPPAGVRPRSASTITSSTAQPPAAGATAPTVRRMVSDYVVEMRIGSGSFATVWRGFHKETGRLAAIKSVNKDRLGVNKKHEDNLDLEIAIMQRIDHPNIVRLFEVKETGRHKYLLLEYCAGGDLSKYIRKHGSMSEKHAKAFFGQLASGLKFLRHANLIHRDLKPQNLLLDSDSPDAILKIADFGFARYMAHDNMAQTLCGSPLYMAPEILGYQSYDASVDLWSIGAILYEMVTGKPPFSGANHIQLLQRINSSTEIKFPQGLELSQECTQLLVALLKKNPRDRITFEQFFAHPFVVEAMEASQAALKKHAIGVQSAAGEARSAPQPTQPQPQSSPPQSSQSSSPQLTSRTDSILRSLQAPTQSSTPPTPHSHAHQQQQQQQTLRNSQLYGSSPSQTTFLQQQQQQQQQQLQFQQQQYQQHQSGLPHSLPTSSHVHRGSLTSHPSQMPSNSPPSSFLPTHPQQQQQVQRPPQQQVGFNTSNVHQQRPITRQITPQNLRGSVGSSEGSASIDPDYVILDGNANSQSAGNLTRDHQPSPPNVHAQHQLQQSPHSHSYSHSPALNESAERKRLQELTKRAVMTAKLGDTKLLALGNSFAHGASFASQDVQGVVAALLEELQGGDEQPLPTMSVSASITSATPAEMLAAALNLYVKAITELSTALTSDLPRIFQALGDSASSVPEGEASWTEIQQYLLDRCQEYWTKSRRVRRGIEEIEAMQSTGGNIVRLPPTALSTAASSRRGSMSANAPSANSAFGSEDKSSASSGDLKEALSRSPSLASQAQQSSRLIQFSLVCPEAQLYDESLVLAEAGAQEEFVGNYTAAKKHYATSAKILEALAQEPDASPADKRRIAETVTAVRRRLDTAARQVEKALADAQSHQQTSHADIVSVH